MTAKRKEKVFVEETIFNPEPVDVRRGLFAFELGPDQPTVPLESLKLCHCRWPFNTLGKVRYCGAEAVVAKGKIGPYCKSHTRLAENDRS